MRAGTLLGAGGATAYYNGVDVSGTVRSLLLSPSGGGFPAWQQRNGAGSAGGGKELESLYRLVRARAFLQATRPVCESARPDRGWAHRSSSWPRMCTVSRASRSPWRTRARAHTLPPLLSCQAV
jgi:hypothetical protein